LKDHGFLTLFSTILVNGSWSSLQSDITASEGYFAASTSGRKLTRCISAMGMSAVLEEGSALAAGAIWKHPSTEIDLKI
jgi:hypothetical protein